MENRELHYKYVISYLLIGLIAAIGFGLFDVPYLVDKISFALTITSLVLGVVAIIYTFISANKQDTQLNKLIETNFSISTASTEIKNAARSLTDQIETIPPRFDKVDAKLELMSQASLATASSTAQSLVTESTDGPASSGEPSLSYLASYLVDLPYAGIAAFYLFHKAYLEDTIIDEKLIEKISGLHFDFFFGILTSAGAAGFLKITYKNGALHPVSETAVMSENIRELIDKVIAAVGSAPDHALTRMIASIDKEFIQ